MRETELLSKVPEHLIEGLRRYINSHIKPGSFLMAVLENDLRESLGRADPASREGLFDLFLYLYNYAPSDCWGSPEKVERWLAKYSEEARWN